MNISNKCLIKLTKLKQRHMGTIIFYTSNNYINLMKKKKINHADVTNTVIL